MSDAKKTQYIKKTSPQGVAEWPYLCSPDTRFKDEGEFKVNLLVDEDAAAPMIKFLEKVRDEYFEELKSGLKPAMAKKLIKREVYDEVLDDESGEPTGQVRFKFGTSAVRKNKKTGETWQHKVPLFDAKGGPITDKINIGNGSILRIGFSPSPYKLNTDSSVGVKLYLNGAKILELKEYGGKDAAAYGLDGDEGNFEYENKGGAAESQVDSEPVDDDVDF